MVKHPQNYQKYDPEKLQEDVWGLQDLDNQDTYLDANKFLDMAIRNSLVSLNKDDIDVDHRISLFRYNVEMLEVISRAVSVIEDEDEYAKNLQQIRERQKKGSETDKQQQSTRNYNFQVAKEKAEALMRKIFENSSFKGEMRVGKVQKQMEEELKESAARRVSEEARMLNKKARENRQAEYGHK